jgi:hypothetical protein
VYEWAAGVTTATLASGNIGAITLPMELTAMMVGDDYDFMIDGVSMWAGTYAFPYQTSTFAGVYCGGTSTVEEIRVTPYVPGGFYDDFDRVDETPLGAPYFSLGGGMPLPELISGEVVVTSSGSGAVVDTGLVDLDIEVIFDGTETQVGIVLCHDVSSGHYLLFWFTPDFGSWQVYNMTAEAGIASGSVAPVSNPITMSVNAVGDTFDWKINGATVWHGVIVWPYRTSTIHGFRANAVGTTVTEVSYAPATFFDDFDRANETPVGPPYGPGLGADQFNLSGNHLVTLTGYWDAVALVDAETEDLTLTAVFDVLATTPGFGLYSIIVSWDSGSNTYMVFNGDASDGTWEVLHVVGGIAEPTVASGSGAPTVGPVTMEVTAVGSDYELKLDGVSVWADTYTGYARTSTRHGVHTLSTTTVEEFGYTVPPPPPPSVVSPDPPVHTDLADIPAEPITINMGQAGDLQNINERPFVPLGESIGPPITIDVLDRFAVPDDRANMFAGDALRLRVTQTGGGVNTDTGLTLTLLLYVHHGSATTTFDWEST